MHFSSISIALILSTVSSVLSVPVQSYNRYDVEDSYNNGEYEMDHRYTDYPENYGKDNEVYRWDEADYKRREELEYDNKAEYVHLRESKYGGERGREHEYESEREYGYERNGSDDPEPRRPLFEEEPVDQENMKKGPVANEEAKTASPESQQKDTTPASTGVNSERVAPASGSTSNDAGTDCPGVAGLLGVCVNVNL
ncbi:hypothetical protein K493DRAFT_313192 [Basidiobolus meristosporus CBS 931.73]|uniref:Uncharacterized protein n=1 Tax=Basidiobolus meristosporus CBS 931.73 TaxID=1314790 RepID=A0A1Y1YNV2_9FUNG|nr:hypothetical protein K493DRAFT_313192 [Basidiobolus meristosporus CBS 931.73]|eukprot:ORX99513.1 hypothetical protein K493DRAFT_313192 [Basidiobolus meristosporus CBS 931.73]